MTSINSLTGSSSTSSIYGSRNVISGLASGLDTETLIENAVKGYQNKITALKQDQEMVQWQQDAYRSIIDKMVKLTRNYTSYTSSTNLMSPSFFNKAVTTKALGQYADMVSASGKTSSRVELNGVQQLAKAATYRTSLNNTALKNMAGVLSADGKQLVTTASGDFDLNSNVNVSDVTGGMYLKYGASSVYLKFDELDAYKDGAELAAGINEKLGESYVKTGSGDYVKASERIEAKFENGQITFSDKSAGKNSVYVESADDSIKKAFGITPGKDAHSLNVPAQLSHEEKAFNYLGDKTLNVNLNGKTKTINLQDVVTDMLKEGKEPTDNEAFVESLNKQLSSKFGEGKITAGLNDGKLSFSTEKGSTLAVTSTAGKAMGLGENGLTSYLNTSAKLGDLGFEFPEDTQKLDKDGKPVTDSEGNPVMEKGKLTMTINGKEFAFDKDTTLNTMMNTINSDKDAGVNISYSKLTNEFLVEAKETGANSKIEFGGLAKDIFGTVETKPSVAGDTQLKEIFTKYSSDNFGEGAFKIQLADGTELSANVYWGGENKGTTLNDIAKQLSKQEGISAVYNESTNSFDITKDGKAMSYTAQEGLAQNLAGTIGRQANAGTYEAGQDAIFKATVNGVEMDLTRSSNEIDFDGMTVTLRDTFGYEDGKFVAGTKPVTFETEADADTIIDAIESFVNDYNEMAEEIRNQYGTLPNYKDNKSTRYKPLTEEDRQSMSDSAIEAYEAKAKQGILFGDTELSMAHDKLRSAITLTGEDAALLKKIGISTTYDNYTTKLSIDKDALRDALKNDPDSVRDIFSKSKESGATSDGLVSRVKTVLDTYASTSTGNQGLLVQKAGTVYSPYSLNSNTLQTKYDNLTTQIEKWQEKMSDRIDYYTSQFTALEQLMSQMNNQSSMLSGMMMGNSGY